MKAPGVIDDAWLTDLAAGGPVNSGDAPTMIRQIATGEVSLGFGLPQHMVRTAKGDGASIEMMLSMDDGGTVITPVVYGLLDETPHVAAAQLLLSWLYTDEAQRAFAEAGEMPLLSGVATPDGVPSIDDLENVVEVVRGDVLSQTMTDIIALHQTLY